METISVYFEYEKNMAKDNMVNNMNEILKQLANLINNSNIKCVDDLLKDTYELPYEFTNKFYNINDDNVGVENSISYEYELNNRYSLDTYAFIMEDFDDELTKMISIHFIVAD